MFSIYVSIRKRKTLKIKINISWHDVNLILGLVRVVVALNKQNIIPQTGMQKLYITNILVGNALASSQAQYRELP